MSSSENSDALRTPVKDKPDGSGSRFQLSLRLHVPTQSPADKLSLAVPPQDFLTISESEEEYARELELIQRKAEEQLARYVDEQLLVKKQEFERRTQAAATRIAATWKHDGLTIDEIIENNFKEYAQQYEGLYTKALALKRTFEDNKKEFERQVILYASFNLLVRRTRALERRVG